MWNEDIMFMELTWYFTGVYEVKTFIKQLQIAKK